MKPTLITKAEFSERFPKPDVDLSDLPKRFLHPGELDCIIALAASVNPRRVIEIGVNTGRTACAILRTCPEVRDYLGLDVAPGYEFARPNQQHEIPTNPGALAKSFEAFSVSVTDHGSLDWKANELGQANFMFIDGDHCERMVRHDSLLAYSAVQSGGIIVWHDYSNTTEDVTSILNTLCECGHDIVHIEGTWLAFEVRP